MYSVMRYLYQWNSGMVQPLQLECEDIRYICTHHLLGYHYIRQNDASSNVLQHLRAEGSGVGHVSVE